MTHKVSFQSVPSQYEQYPCKRQKKRESKLQTLFQESVSIQMNVALWLSGPQCSLVVSCHKATSPELLPDCLAFQGLHIKVVCTSRHDEECDDGHVAVIDLGQADQT